MTLAGGRDSYNSAEQSDSMAGSSTTASASSVYTVLVVDDDAGIRELLRAALEREHFKVHEAETSTDLYKTLEHTPVDLITMDVMLDQESGMDLVRDLRKQSEIPIILVTGRVDLIDTVMGLELGADDYITKPFLMREFIARVRSVLRRARIGSGLVNKDQPGVGLQGNRFAVQKADDQAFENITFGDWSINTASRELRNTSGQVVNLTTAEFDLLDIFVKAPQRVLSREQLMQRLTGRSWSPTDRIIDNHVAQLRKKIDQSGAPEWIKTIRGAGYMFTSKPQRRALEEN